MRQYCSKSVAEIAVSPVWREQSDYGKWSQKIKSKRDFALTSAVILVCTVTTGMGRAKRGVRCGFWPDSPKNARCHLRNGARVVPGCTDSSRKCGITLDALSLSDSRGLQNQPCTGMVGPATPFSNLRGVSLQSRESQT